MLYFKSVEMNAIVNKLLSGGDKFMPELHLKQPGSSVCGILTKNEERVKNI